MDVARSAGTGDVVNEVSIEELQKAIRHNFGCESRHVGEEPITETHDGRIAWQGAVQVFDLIGHSAPRCYAWSHATDDPKKRRFVTVLHVPPVDSPRAAVRAAAVAEARRRKGNA